MTHHIEVALDANTLLGEGAIWDHRRRRLLFVDIEGHRLYRYDPAADRLTEVDLGQRVGTVVPAADGRLLAALEKSVVVLEPDKDTVETVLTVEPDLPHNRFNDGKCDPAGRFWVGTMAMDRVAGNAALYRVDTDFSVTRMVSGVTISNGLAWSRDGTRMFYIDTPSRRVDWFDYDLETGALGERHTLFDVPAELGHPDGMTIDRDGRLWIAMFGGAAVTCWDPGERRLAGTFPVPAKNVTSCAFGGDALDELYITTARIEMTDADQAAFPLAGSLFRLRPGAAGIPCFEFGG